MPQKIDRIAPQWHRRLAAIAAAIAVGLLAWWAGRSLAGHALHAIADVNALGPRAAVAFIAIYAVSVVAFVPATLMTAAGGAIFGLAYGFLYSVIGGTIGSTCAFLLGRYGARRIVERRLAAMPRFAAIDRAVAAQGWRIVLLLRLSPVMPFNILNYAIGLTTISVWDFVIAGIGSIPAELAAAYGGKLGGEALALAGEAEPPQDASYYAILAAGLVATIAAIFVVTRTARRALRDV
jgi:uncharacterized membrane protein YdjX (TVP38/TMEM64 family)